MMFFVPGKGFQIAANFNSHRAHCDQCKKAEDNLALLCLEGTILYKRENAVVPKRERPAKSYFHCTKEELARLMRYKEPDDAA